MSKYFGEFKSYKDMTNQWPASKAVAPGQIIMAGYFTESYEGSATAIFEKDGKLFEANETHCSCNGLDNFVQEETSWAALNRRYWWNTGEAWKIKIANFAKAAENG